jgi:hypothetical protein
MALTIGSGITIGAGVAITPSTQYGSYVFNGTSSWMNILGSLSDWNLGSTYTIEWWQNSPSSLPGSIYTAASQGDSSSAIDVFWNSGDLQLRNGSSGATGEPTPNVWNQIAVISTAGALAVYYNGTAVSSSGGGGSLSDVASTVAVGRRGPNNDFQYFSGKIAGLRINNTAVYAGNFDVTASAVLYPQNIAGTVLLLTGAQATPYVDSSSSAHAITPANMTWSAEYPGQ